MSRTEFAFLMAGVAVVILALMWLGWRARARRDSRIQLAAHEVTGELLAEFTGVQYVSTTPLGAPLERIAVAGLRYKGLAELTVRTGGITIAVTGEPAVSIPAAYVLGASRSSGRVGKAVESGGLSVLEWRTSEGLELESGFRFSAPARQREFDSAIAGLVTPHPQTTAQADSADAANSTISTDTTQEDA